MHLLTCPSCQQPLQVAPSQAGDTTNCPNCQSPVAIPKLGELRQLPLAEISGESAADRDTAPPASPLRRGLFVGFGLLAALAFVTAGFCGLRWYLIDAPLNTEIHIETMREQYGDLSAAQLIREYEDMEKYGLDLASPYKYKVVLTKKEGWGRNAFIASLIGGIALLGAVGVSLSGGRNQA